MNEKTEALDLALTRLTRENTHKCARGKYAFFKHNNSVLTHVACPTPEFQMNP